METLEFIEKHLDFTMPKNFEQLDVDYKHQYFGTNVPDVLYGNKRDKAFLTINIIEKVSPYNIDERITAYYSLYQRTAPNFSNVKTVGRKLNNGAGMGAIQFTSTAPERDLYNLVGIFPVEDKEVVFTMHCDVNDGIKYAIDYMNLLSYLQIKM